MLNLSERYWRDIEGYEGVYQVHREGYVRNASGQILAGSIAPNGYRRVNLYIPNSGGEFKSFSVHRLVALAWVRNRKPDVYDEVNHRDGDKLNCRWTNLQWCTRLMNIRHAWRTGLSTYTKPAAGTKHAKSGTSRFYGVSFSTSRQRWRAYVRHEGKDLHHKWFNTELEAAIHYNWIVTHCNLDRPLNVIESKCVTTIERKPRCLTAKELSILNHALAIDLAAGLALVT